MKSIDTLIMTNENNDSLISWIEKRIKKTEIERDNTDEPNLKIGKGAKLCAYKEILNYINEHK